MLAGAITIFPVGIFLAAALFVIAYVMWETRIVYKLTATEALGVGGATLIVILLCLLLLSKACTDTVSPHLTGDGDKAPAPGVRSLTMQGDAGADPGFVFVSRLPSFPLARAERDWSPASVTVNGKPPPNRRR